MATNFKVSLSNIIKELSFKTLYMPKNPDEIFISSKDVSRPGLEFTGFLEHFDKNRILVMGNTENSLLERFDKNERYLSIKKVFDFNPPALIVARNILPYDEIMRAAKICGIPILKTSQATSSVEADLVIHLCNELAPRVTRHGVFVEVYGEGIFIMGDSGIGKSEVAIELIKRGHRLIADDAVKIKRINKNTLLGSSPENIRHFIEVRGIGIINARKIFGIGSVKLSNTVDLVANLELWNKSNTYDRMGIKNEYIDILGLNVPIVTIPVKPGRNIAIIIEVAAMNFRQKKLGYNAAKELLCSVGMGYDPDDDVQEKVIKYL